MTVPFVDCIGLAGAWTLGTVQAGFELTTRVSLKGGFGDAAVAANRHLLEGPWEQQSGTGWQTWEPVTAAYVCGTPPCSGFSGLNQTANRARNLGEERPSNAVGADSDINECMWEMVRYAGRLTGVDGTPGPEIFSLESVQDAFKVGRPLMQALREDLERATGQSYGLAHVLMSGASVGAAQRRHRYYMILHRIPFGVDPPDRRPVATVKDAIGDLVDLDPFTWEEQPTHHRPSLWAGAKVREDGLVADHSAPSPEGLTFLGLELADFWPLLEPGDSAGNMVDAYVKAHGQPPPLAGHRWREGKWHGFGGSCRKLDPTKLGPVLTGNCIRENLHWAEPRHITAREAARLMGYPDSWTWAGAAESHGTAAAWIGKCCPVDSGRWISTWVMRALAGPIQPLMPFIGERETMVDFTKTYLDWPVGYDSVPVT